MKETEDWEQRVHQQKFPIFTSERTVNPLKLLWSSSSDITKATGRDLEEMAEVGMPVSHPTTPTASTEQKHKPETFNHKGKLSTYQKYESEGSSFKKTCKTVEE